MGSQESSSEAFAQLRPDVAEIGGEKHMPLQNKLDV